MSTASLQNATGNPNHHLWNNHGTWWAHATVLHHGLVQERLRRSLHTGNLDEARRKRDAFLADLVKRPDLQLSIRVGRPRRHVDSRAPAAPAQEIATASEVRPS